MGETAMDVSVRARSVTSLAVPARHQSRIASDVPQTTFEFLRRYSSEERILRQATRHDGADFDPKLHQPVHTLISEHGTSISWLLSKHALRSYLFHLKGSVSRHIQGEWQTNPNRPHHKCRLWAPTHPALHTYSTQLRASAKKSKTTIASYIRPSVITTATVLSSLIFWENGKDMELAPWVFRASWCLRTTRSEGGVDRDTTTEKVTFELIQSAEINLPICPSPALVICRTDGVVRLVR